VAGWDPIDLDQFPARRIRDREERSASVQEPQRQLLEAGCEHAAQAGSKLADEQRSVGMVDERNARLAEPQRGQEHDPVDHLEDHVGVAAKPA